MHDHMAANMQLNQCGYFLWEPTGGQQTIKALSEDADSSLPRATYAYITALYSMLSANTKRGAAD